MGYSEKELFRDITRLNIRRDCELFRHDQTVINLLLRKHISVSKIHSHSLYAALVESADVKILNQRGHSYKYIKYSMPKSIAALVLTYCTVGDLIARALTKCRNAFRISTIAIF